MNNIEELTTKVKEVYPKVLEVRKEISKVIIGQTEVIDRLLIGLIGDGHILIEGVPGLAKTTIIKALADTINATFRRIQFTPDLLPADIIGTQLYSMKNESFMVKKGPVFANIILADEINRAPAKVQSALLEAMQERQVTIGEESFKLPHPFLVLATQNPVEQEGTYPLPEAQVDRFMLKVNITYPSKKEEIDIIKKITAVSTDKVNAIFSPDDIYALRMLVDELFVDEKIYDYVTSIVFATRYPEKFGLTELKPLIEYGASPRASIYLIKAARVFAFLNGRAYVTPQDIKSISYDVLRHRVILSYEAEAQDLNADAVIMKILDKIDVP